MSTAEVTARIARALAGERGWEHSHPGRFRHHASGVQVLVHPDSVRVVIDPAPGESWGTGVSASTALVPDAAIASVLRVARALVVVQQQQAKEAQERAQRRDVDVLAETG